MAIAVMLRLDRTPGEAERERVSDPDPFVTNQRQIERPRRMLPG